MKVCIVAILVVLLSVSSYDAKPALCSNMVNCFVNPCQVSRCAAHPTAKCTANYCGGCHAFWDVGGQRVDCSAPVSAPVVEVQETKCIQVNCFVDPCGFAKCNKHENAICRANYCGGCNAWFYVSGKRVECD